MGLAGSHQQVSLPTKPTDESEFPSPSGLVREAPSPFFPAVCMCMVLFLSPLEKTIIFLSISVLASGQGWEIRRAVSWLCLSSSPGTGLGLPLQKQQLSSGLPRHVGVI